MARPIHALTSSHAYVRVHCTHVHTPIHAVCVLTCVRSHMHTNVCSHDHTCTRTAQQYHMLCTHVGDGKAQQGSRHTPGRRAGWCGRSCQQSQPREYHILWGHEECCEGRLCQGACACILQICRCMCVQTCMSVPPRHACLRNTLV